MEVPYVMYMSESEAKRILAGYGLKYSVSAKKSETVSAGLVMEQSISAGKSVKPGTRVKIVVSKGRSRGYRYRTCAGMTVENAANKLGEQRPQIFRDIQPQREHRLGQGDIVLAGRQA